jgi:hypothetical protein
MPCKHKSVEDFVPPLGSKNLPFPTVTGPEARPELDRDDAQKTDRCARHHCHDVHAAPRLSAGASQRKNL